MSNQREKQTLDRILNMNWRTGDPDRQPSQLALFNEYLRRVGLWYQALDIPDAHPIVSDLPGNLVEGIKAKPVSTTLMQQTLRTLGRTSIYERMLLTRALDWAAIADTDAVVTYNLPDPYEPLILFHERGGWLNKAGLDGEWNISGVVGTIHRAHAYCHLTPLDLNTAALDALDVVQPT